MRDALNIVAACVAATFLMGCVVATTAAKVTGSVISTTADVTGSVIGGAARTVTGSGDDDDN